MPSTVTQYEILISCPGDIEGVIPLINSAVEKFNIYSPEYESLVV